MPEVEKEIEQPNSCEVSINAKGQFSGKVKVYAQTIQEAFDKTMIFSDKLERLIKEKNKE